MKKILFLTITALLLAVSCNEIETPVVDQTGTLSISFANLQTKAGETVTATTDEKKLNSVNAYIFDASTNALSYSGAFTADEITANKKKFQVACRNYKVYVVANKTLSGITKLSDLESAAITLDDNTSNSFVMAGSGTVTVESTHTEANAAQCAVTLDRFVGRVRLMSVSGATCDYAFLENVVANQNIGGNAGNSWANLAGRKSGSIVNTSNADCPTLTCKAYAAESVFYGYANGTSSDQTGPTATAGKTRLAVKAKWNGTAYWYPITIDGFARNTNYDITLTISGPGSDDPNTPVVKGYLNVTITVSDWVNGTSINTTI